MNSVVIAGALAWLIVSLHVSTHGGSFWRWLAGFWLFLISSAITARILEVAFP